MSRIILISIFSCVSLMSSVIGQCVFPDYDNYGLTCDEARFLCGYEMDGFTGRLLGQDSPQPQPHPLCAGSGEADNIQWFSFVADDDNIEIVISYRDCTGNILDPGLQVGIFENCDLGPGNEPLGSIYCIEGFNYSNIILIPDSMDIEVGQLYLIFIDGYAGSACDFEIDVIQGVCTDAPDPTQECEQDCGVVSSYPVNQGCTLFRDTFMFTPSSQIIADVFGCNPGVNNTRLDSIICVEWDIQPDTGFTFISSSFEFYDSLGVLPTLIVEWTEPGTYTINPIITFNPLFSTCQGMCACTDDVVYTIEITESTVLQLPAVELCPGECIDFCSETFCETGEQFCFDRDQCLIEVLSITARPNIEIDNGSIFLCPGECYEFQDSLYCDSDSYEVSDSAACDTTYLFQIEELILLTNLVQAEDLINCTKAEVVLVGGWNTNFTGTINSVWISETGDTISFDNEYAATEGGDYTFVVWAEGKKSCSVSMTHTVVKDDDVPVVTINTPFLDCNNPQDNITINTVDNIMSTEWTGPDGFSSSDKNPEIDQSGIYEVTVTAANGCKLISNTEVIGDFNEPDVNVTYDNLTCSENISTAQYSSMTSLISHQWSLPDGSNVTDDVLNMNSPGNYSIEVTAVNGCTNTADFNVLDLTYDPSLQLNEDRIWRCLDTEIVLDLNSQQAQDLKYVWSDIGGGILSNSINLTITSPGVYILTIEDTNVKCVGTDTVRIIEDPYPFEDIELSISSPLCEGGTDGFVEIVTFDGGEGPYTYEINGAFYSDLSNLSLEVGLHKMNIVDVFGCSITKDIEVPEAEVFIVDVVPELTIRYGQNKTLTFDTDLDDSEIGLIEWSNDQDEILSIDREVELVGDFNEFVTLRVESIDGCEVISKIAIDLSYEVDIYYPNVFSPNTDGNNDLFVLYSDGFPEMADDLKIFDRSGELIYKSTQTEFNETKIGWDGTFNGDPCQPGVYVFILEYTLLNGYSKSISGSITLVR